MQCLMVGHAFLRLSHSLRILNCLNQTTISVKYFFGCALDLVVEDEWEANCAARLRRESNRMQCMVEEYASPPNYPVVVSWFEPTGNRDTLLVDEEHQQTILAVRYDAFSFSYSKILQFGPRDFRVRIFSFRKDPAQPKVKWTILQKHTNISGLVGRFPLRAHQSYCREATGGMQPKWHGNWRDLLRTAVSTLRRPIYMTSNCP